jgi:hypothetical protein
MKSRTTKDGPFCWQAKESLRAIRDRFDAAHNVASAIAVYVALSEIASNKGCESFEATQGEVAQKSGLSPNTVRKVLAGLKAAGLLHESPNFYESGEGETSGRAPSTFILLPHPSHNQCATSRNNCATLRNGPSKRPLRSNTRKKEESNKENLKDGAVSPIIDSQQQRLGSIFGRRSTTCWTARELDAFKKVQPIVDEELRLVEERYSAERLQPESNCRHDLQTLLNNFPSEVDRARAWKERQSGVRAPRGVTKPQFAHESLRMVPT